MPAPGERFTRVQQEVQQNIREMAALHKERRKRAGKPLLEFDCGGDRAGKHLVAGPLDFLNHLQPLDPALAQLRITHDLGDDLVGPGDFLLDDFNLLGREAGLRAQRASQRVGGVVDDCQRVFYLVRELGRQPAGGMQLPFAGGKLSRLKNGPALALEQHLGP